MHPSLRLLALPLLMPATGVLAQSTTPNIAAQTLEVGPDGRANGQVGTQPIRWQIDASGSSAPVLNPDAARRLGVRAGWVGVAIGIGPVRLTGRSAVLRYAVAGMDNRRRAAWFDREIAPSADGMIGPGGVRQRVVRFTLRPALGGETETVLPLVDRGIAGMGTMIDDLFVQFDPQMPRSLTTAAGGVVMAQRWDGQLAGDTRSRVVRLNVERPVRQLTIRRALPIGGLRLRTVDVRTHDYGSVGAIPDAANITDPDEIVVVARGRPRRNQQRILIVGADALANCSSISFDKSREVIRLRCMAE